jgi:hypothetical protein
MKQGVLKWLIATVLSLVLQGCVVVAVADLVATTAVKTVGLAVDGVVGTAKVVGGVFVPSDNKKDKQ